MRRYTWFLLFCTSVLIGCEAPTAPPIQTETDCTGGGTVLIPPEGDGKDAQGNPEPSQQAGTTGGGCKTKTRVGETVR